MSKYTLTIEYEAEDPVYPVDKVTIITPKILHPYVLPFLRKVLRLLSNDGVLVPALDNLPHKSNKRST
jgi:hypothetical protein